MSLPAWEELEEAARAAFVRLWLRAGDSISQEKTDLAREFYQTGFLAGALWEVRRLRKEITR